MISAQKRCSVRLHPPPPYVYRRGYVLLCCLCLFVLFLLVIVLSVFTDSDYPFCVFKLFLWPYSLGSYTRRGSRILRQGGALLGEWSGDRLGPQWVQGSARWGDRGAKSPEAPGNQKIQDLFSEPKLIKIVPCAA